MQKRVFITICIVGIVLALSGCKAKHETKEAKEYLNKVATYTADVNNYTKNTTNLISSDKPLATKSISLLAETKKMHKEIKAFNAIEPPRTLRHVHRKIEAQNYLLDDSLYLLEGSVKAGKVTTSALANGVEKVKTSETSEKIDDFVELFKSKR